MKQFWIALVADDPWQYLQQVPLPSNLRVFSGHYLRKKHMAESEVCIVSNEQSWLKIDQEKRIAISAPFDIKPEDRFLPIPWASFKFELEAIHIFRDVFGIHPLYYSKLPFGFAFSPRKEWLLYLQTYPEEFPRGTFAIADEAGIRFRNYPQLPQFPLDVLKKLITFFRDANVIPCYNIESLYILSFISNVEPDMRVLLLDIDDDMIQLAEKLQLTVKTVKTTVNEEILKDVIQLAELDPRTYEVNVFLEALRLYIISKNLSVESKVLYCGYGFFDVAFKILFPRLMAFPAFIIPSNEKEKFLQKNMGVNEKLSAWFDIVRKHLMDEVQQIFGTKELIHGLLKIFKQAFPFYA